MAFGWKSYVTSVTVKEGPKQYGFYRRNKKTFFRNYHRELRNGRGLSFIDILTLKIKEAEEAIGKEVSRAFYRSFDLQFEE